MICLKFLCGQRCMRLWMDGCLHWPGSWNEQASAMCMWQRCARLESNRTHGRLAGRGLAIAAEFFVAANATVNVRDAAAMTLREPKLCEARFWLVSVICVKSVNLRITDWMTMILWKMLCYEKLSVGTIFYESNRGLIEIFFHVLYMHLL